MSKTRDRPIIFGSEMVHAVLNGRKTQTRRVVKPQPPSRIYSDGNTRWSPSGVWGGKDWFCPYGQPGDHLWVRETWGEFFLDGAGECVVYRADGEIDMSHMAFGRWRPSIHMPRWASRITLEVTGIRAERVQDITIRDILAEGIDSSPSWDSDDVIAAKWIELWDGINAKRGYSWDSNPWVWVIEFKAMEGGE